MAVGSIIARFGGLGLRILQLCVSGIALGIFSYFLSVLADNNLPIYTRWKAVEGLTGASTLYAIFGILFVLFLGGNRVFGSIALILDILFVGAWAAVAYLARHGSGSCKGVVNTPLGIGQSNSGSQGYGADGFGFGNNENSTYFPSLHYACILTRVVFACAIIAIFLFLVSAAWNLLMMKQHKKDKMHGPGPNNNYTKGTGKTPFWKRNKRAKHTKDAEAGIIGGTAVRHSHETGTTLGGNNYAGAEPKYGHEAGVGHGHNHTHGHAQPPYGQQPAYGQPGYGQTGTFHDRTTF